MRPRLSAQALLVCGALLASCGSTPTTSTGTTSARDPLNFTPSSLPVGYVGESYKTDIVVTGGAGPYSMRVTSGTLPPGVSLQNRQVIGTPTKTGTYSFTVEASDSNLSSKAQAYTVNVNDLPPLSFKPQLPAGELRGETRIPLNVVAPRAVRAARVVWELPEGVSVTRVQLAEGGVGGVLFWKQAGRSLTLDLGFKAVPRSGARVALIGLKPQKAVTLDANKMTVEARDGEGKLLTEAPKAEAPKSETGTTPGKPAAPAGTAPGASSPATPGTGTPAQNAPAQNTPTQPAAPTPPNTTAPPPAGTTNPAPPAPGGK